MLSIILNVLTRQVVVSGSKRTIYYELPRLASSQRLAFKQQQKTQQYYYVALSADEILTGLQVKVFSYYSHSEVGLIYQQHQVILRNSNITFENLQSSTPCVVISQNDIFQSVNSTVNFFYSMTHPIVPSQVAAQVINNGNTHSYSQSILPQNYLGAPCTACMTSSQLLTENCFGCGLAQSRNGMTCECTFTGATLSQAGECVNYVEPIRTDTNLTYYSACAKNKQITIPTGNPLSTTPFFSILKDDSCSPTNLYLNGIMYADGDTTNISGLVPTQTLSISYIFSSIEIYLQKSVQNVALIALTFTDSVTASYITLNGRINDTAEIFNTVSRFGGIYAYSIQPFTENVDEESGDSTWTRGTLQKATLNHIRLLGFRMLMSQKNNVGGIVGKDEGCTYSVDDFVIASISNANYTTAVANPTDYSYDDVVFPCKNSAQSEQIKLSMRLQRLSNQINDASQNTQFSFNLANSSFMFGILGNGTVDVKNVMITGYLNGSTHSQYGRDNVGFLAGVLTGTTYSISNCYCGGKITSFNNVGMIGLAEKRSSVSIIMADQVGYDGNDVGGTIGYLYQSTVTDMKIAQDCFIDTYLYKTGLVGKIEQSSMTVSEAFGQHSITANHHNYIGYVVGTDSTLNGAAVTGSAVDSLEGMVIGTCMNNS